MTDNEKEPTKYLAKCLDPVHIGTGSFRLSRVDNSIVREPATGIPKIPGTSLSGAIRDYVEQVIADKKDIDVIFGTEKDEGRQGMLRFYDAQIVLFPVISSKGTVWISTYERLKYWLNTDGANSFKVPDKIQDENKVVFLKGIIPGTDDIDLGWLYLEVESSSTKTEEKSLPTGFEFVDKVVMVSDKIFYHLVNDNLEVRTSVKINDKTGAAESRALFIYEAIPRGTIMGFEIYIDDRQGNGIKKEKINNYLNKSFAYMKLLGVGGMVTRGFGRLDVLNGGK